MKLPYASDHTSETGPKASRSAGLLSVTPLGAADYPDPLNSNASAEPVAIAVVCLDARSCVSQFNSVARELLGDQLQGQAWPMLRQAVFATDRITRELTHRDGRVFREQHCADAHGSARMVCLQQTPVASQVSAQHTHLAELVHQMRTPLTASGLYLDQLKRRLVGDPSLQRLAQKSSDHLRALDAIVDVSLAPQASACHRAQLISVASVLQRLHEQCAVVVMSMGAHLHSSPFEQNLYLHAEPTALLSALSNLVINAAQHPRKGALLRICVRARRLADRVVFDISDSGKGVSDAYAAQIFNPLASARSGGTGLGLAVARATLLQFDAQIELAKNAEGGATFSVDFPAQAIDVAA